MRTANPVQRALREAHVRRIYGREIQRADAELAKLPQRRSDWTAAGSDASLWDTSEARQLARKARAERRLTNAHGARELGATIDPARARRAPLARPAARRPRCSRPSTTSRAGPGDSSEPGEPEPPRRSRRRGGAW
jgi:hypothetical protein